MIHEGVDGTEMFGTASSRDQKPKGVQYRNRTTFTPEQSRALEQGDLTSSNPCVSQSSTMLHFSRQNIQLNTDCFPPNQSFLTVSMQICTRERNYPLKSNFLRTPSRYTLFKKNFFFYIELFTSSIFLLLLWFSVSQRSGFQTDEPSGGGKPSRGTARRVSVCLSTHSLELRVHDKV